MRDYLVFYLNGKRQLVSGDKCFMSLATYLRQEQSATGTKVVCEEGDCGACTVLLGRFDGRELTYRAVNACILFLYQIDCTHVVSVEGLKYQDKLNPIQEAMVQCHGSQCGYCTPGFITAMCGMFEQCAPATEQDVKDGLTGNLCRCTGYEPIIKSTLSVDTGKVLKLGELYPTQSMLQDFTEQKQIAVLVKASHHTLCIPCDVNAAITFKSQHDAVTIVAGGTDVCVYWNKRGWQPRYLLSLSNIDGLNGITVEGANLHVGAMTTLSQLESWAEQNLPELKRILWLFGSPQIRHAGTLAGNIANGSPIADSLPYLFVMEATVELAGMMGKREVNINQFYKGYKEIDIKRDELIRAITIPLPAKTETLRLYKVSKRQNLDISSFTAAFRYTLAKGKFDKVSIAYGGVAPTVLRMKATETFLRGKPFDVHTLTAAGEVAVSEIAPITDVRGSQDFRNTLAKNVLLKLFFDAQPTTAEVTA